jgi:3-ketosteroid 9alpha-monooxygenase subunit B
MAPLSLPSSGTALPSVTPASSTVAAPPRGIRNMDAICVDVVRRTPDSATLYFFVGDHGGYKAGQFVSIDPKQFPELARWCEYYKKLKGKPEAVRAYSMSSIPSEKYISITVKAEPYDPVNNDYPPLLSPFLASGALKGRELILRGFSGPYTLADDHAQKTTQVVHFVAGSGVVPNYAILKDELKKPENASVKHTFIDVNKTVDDIIFREQLDALARAYPDRMQLVHLITRDENPERYGPQFHKGRPTLEFVKRYVQDPTTVLIYSCGPAITKYEKEKAKRDGTTPKPRFIESVEEIVHGLGVSHDRFKKEEFG